MCNGTYVDYEGFLAGVRAKIDEHGYTVQGVLEEADRPGWMYTIGLEQSRSHPELLIVGLEQRTSYALLTKVADDVIGGNRYEPNKPISGLIKDGYDLMPIEVMNVDEDDWFNIAKNYYGHSDFTVLQLVWPDMDNVYPWEPGYEVRYRQPLVGEVPI